jgi:chitodextrinase
VHAGDLLVGWFGQYAASGRVQVSDNVNGAWTRSSASTTWGSGHGDLALYYVQNSAPAGNGLTITISASSATYLQGAVSEYGGVATSGAIDQVAVARGNSATVDSGATGSVGAGELVVGGIITGGSPGTVTPGSSAGQTFTMRAHTSGYSADLEDIQSSGAGAQDARATFSTSTDWYAVAATFHAYGSGSTSPPTVPGGLKTTSVTSNSVGLSWTASTDSSGTLAGYTVYRNGTSIGTTNATTTTFTDSTAQPSTTYTYTVDAYDTAGNHSAQSPGLQVTTPAGTSSSVKWVQGGTVSTGSQVTSVTIKLSGAVNVGDLLVGWFGQYNSSGQVHVSDNVNGAWTRSSASTTFGSHGDLALYYVQNSAAAPSGLTITITATSATYLQGTMSEYSGVATTGALDQAAAAKGNSATVDSGPTAAVGAGELVIGGIITGGSPSSVTPGSTQGLAFTIRSKTSSGSADFEDVLVSAAGAQDARATFASATDWYAVVAVFHHA